MNDSAFEGRYCKSIAKSLWRAYIIVWLIFSYLCRRKLYEKLEIVGLRGCLVRGAVAVYLTALLTFMQNYIALFCVDYDLYGLHLSVTLTSSVAGIYIKMERPQTKRAMIARGVSQGLDLTAAMLAYKSVVVL